MAEARWYCVRQRAGPLVKECRALRADFSRPQTAQDTRARSALKPGQTSAVCRTQADSLELRLALFGFEGIHYTLTYDDFHLPRTFGEVRKTIRAFQERARRFIRKKDIDWIYCIEALHGNHRFHVHMVFRESDLQPAVVRHLWKHGQVDDEDVLMKEGGYRRLAEYFNKERPDGFFIPLGRHPWSCSRSLRAQLEPPERWVDGSGVIDIPEAAIWSRRGDCCNDFGAYYYGSYILKQ